MKKTARLIVTYDCNRNCEGCCMKQEHNARQIEDIEELFRYEEIVITGGEPTLLGQRIDSFIKKLRQMDYKGKIYMYCASYRHDIPTQLLDGFTFTLHYPCSDQDIYDLITLSQILIYEEEMTYFHKPNARLLIDKRVYDQYDFSNIDFSGWSIIRKLQWKEVCEPAPNEELLVYLI